MKDKKNKIATQVRRNLKEGKTPVEWITQVRPIARNNLSFSSYRFHPNNINNISRLRKWKGLGRQQILFNQALRKDNGITNIVVIGLLHLEVVIRVRLLIRLCMLEVEMNFSYPFLILSFIYIFCILNFYNIFDTFTFSFLRIIIT